MRNIKAKKLKSFMPAFIFLLKACNMMGYSQLCLMKKPYIQQISLLIRK